MTRRTRSVRLFGAFAALALLAPRLAHAAPDYAPGSAEWNGLTELRALASANGVDLEPVRSVDVDRLDPRDALFVLYPERRLPVGSIITFLRSGGRMALADDFGEGRALLRRFAIERGTPHGAAGTRLRESDALLVARPRAVHPLTEGIEILVTNHPASLRHPELEPLFAFGDGPDALVLSGTVGDGRLVAVGDPSLFINQMLAIEGNRRFAAALLRFLAGDARGRVYVLCGDAEVRGADRDDPDASPRERVDEVLRSIAQAEVPALALRIAAIVLCVIFAAVASGSVALRGPYGAESMLPEPRNGGGFSGWVRFYQGPTRARGSRKTLDHPRNLLYPTLMYKTELEAALANSLGLPEGARADALVAATPAPLRDRARALLDELASLERGERASGVAPEVPTRAFLRFRARGTALLDALEGKSR